MSSPLARLKISGNFCAARLLQHTKKRERESSTRRIDIFSSNGGRLKLNFDIIFKVENVGFFFFCFWAEARWSNSGVIIGSILIL